VSFAWPGCHAVAWDLSCGWPPPAAHLFRRNGLEQTGLADCGELPSRSSSAVLHERDRVGLANAVLHDTGVECPCIGGWLDGPAVGDG
jgi:hypothetical protein